jgi:AbrB family looped-hinge helix DNA binding protein
MPDVVAERSLRSLAILYALIAARKLRNWTGANARFLTAGVVRRYLTLMKTTISSKGQIVIPAELRQQDQIEAGQEFLVERIDRGEYRLVRTAAPMNDGVVEWLLACPEKDFFVPVESESTDSL